MVEDDVLPVSMRVNRLFETFHIEAGREWTNGDVAQAVSLALGRDVAPREIEDLRSGAFDSDGRGELPLLEALADHFGVSAVYLTGTGEGVERMDADLRLVAAVRDARVTGLALRGDALNLDDLPGIFTKLAEQQHLS